MNLFMMWMSGNSVQIFSIMITGMMIFNAIKAVSNVPTVFEKFQGGSDGAASFLPQKVAYLVVQMVIVGLALWKCQSMGLLPTSHSDWLSFLPMKTVRRE